MMMGCEQERMLQFLVGCDGDPKPLPRWKPNNVEPAPNCPRCASSNTKFCYYNNYSLSQPRYLCKACRRYWTKGGFLRNVPVGGGTRKSRRTKTPRFPQNQPLSTNYTASSFGEGSEANTSHEANGSDIDMALVFAKFLSSGHDSNTEAANGTPESLDTENDAPLPSDPVTDVMLEGEGLPRDESTSIQNFGLMNGIELEWKSLLGGDGGGGGGDLEVVQDVFCWSDATTSSSSVTWQPPLMQLQEELENPILFNNDEVAQLPITDTWNWNSFDFSTLQVFSSRP